MSDDTAWFEDDLEPTPRPRRRIVLAVGLAAVSWIVVALVLVRGASDQPEAGASTPDASAADGSAADASAPADHAPGGAGSAHDDRGGSDPGTADVAGDAEAPAPDQDTAEVVGRDQAEALVVAVVRGWLSDGGPDLAIPGIAVDRRAYLEHVAIEGIDLPSDDLAVARTLLVLLVRDGDHYTDAVVRRAAVPLTVTTTSVHPGGAPWWLPSEPDLTPVPPEATAMDGEDELAATASALEEAGYDEVEVESIGVTASGTVVATVAARTPAGDTVDGPVWLQPTADGLVVLGGPHGSSASDGPVDPTEPGADDPGPDG